MPTRRTTRPVGWSFLETNRELQRFFQHCIALRKRHTVFRREHFFNAEMTGHTSEIVWQALQPNTTNWAADCSHLAFLLDGRLQRDDHFFIMMNGSREEAVAFFLPPSPGDRNSGKWHKIVDTAARSPLDFVQLGDAEIFEENDSVTVQAMAVVVLQAQGE